jgi:hypothetical protein
LASKMATTDFVIYHENSRCILHFNLCPNTRF